MEREKGKKNGQTADIGQVDPVKFPRTLSLNCKFHYELIHKYFLQNFYLPSPQNS